MYQSVTSCFLDKDIKMKKIVFRNQDGSVGVIHPTQEAINVFGIEAIAKKDVPAGLPYKIVDESEIPSDRTFRNAWEWNDTVEPDGVGSVFNTFEEIE